jgi:hypothetical protein
MATTQNTYTGNGSTVLYSFTFPYLENTAIKVSLNGVITTAYTLANATTIQFTTAPANGAAIRIFRVTDDATLAATFYPGSSIRSQDLNENFTQNLYVTQESNRDATTATSTAEGAVTTANTALSNSTAATSTANTASANASAAVSTANTANSNASAAVSTANTASSTASAAVSTANAATSTANTALSTANAANSTSQTANTNSQNAVSIANSALNVLAGSLLFTAVANVAAIPLSPQPGDSIQVQDSTGIASFTPLSGLPAGFVGTAQLNVRLQWDDPNSTWDYLGYGANDPDIRYVVQGKLGTATLPAYYFDQDTGFYSPGSNEIGISTGGTTRLTIDGSGNVAIPGGLTKGGSNVVTVGDTGTVTSTMILDGTILNADINASAAIAGTKISPDFGSQTVTTTGVISSALGAAATPSITFTGDLNTGIYSPGADQLAVATNGTGRLFIDASGNVGVGISNPGSYSSSANNLVVQDTAGEGGITIVSSTTGGSNIFFADTDGTAQGQIKYQHNGDYMRFYTNATERLRITSAGLVGIGTSSPGKTLDVNGSFRQLGGEFIIEPTAPFTVVSIAPQTSTNGAILRFANGSTTSYFGKENSGGDYTWASGGTAYATVISAYGSTAPIQFGHNSPSVTLDSSGRLGIGSTAPATQFAVQNASTSLGIEVDTTSGFASGPTVRGYYRAGSAYTTLSLSGSQVAFGINDVEKARLDASGRLLVGTSSSPSLTDGQYSKLHVIGNSNSATGNGFINIGRGLAASGALAGGTGLGVLQFTDNAGAVHAAISGDTDATTGTNDYPGRLVFSTTADGASSPTERMRITSEGRFFVPGVWDFSTSSGTTVVVTSDDQIRKAASSIKYKTDVEELQDSYADQILNIRPVWYRSLCDGDDPNHSYWGFIAEEVAEIDPRLTTWKFHNVSYDENGSRLVTKLDNPEPEGVAYDRFVPHLLNLVKRQQQAIETLEAKVAALESQ